MEYLVRFAQMHETFRKPEIDALARLAGLHLRWIFYSDDSPFAIIQLRGVSDSEAAAKTLISRSILSNAIYELWGAGVDYDSLHRDVRHRTEALWPRYRLPSFRFEVDSFRGSHSTSRQREIIETFSYTDFEGPIVMNDPDNQFVVFEDYDLNAPVPKQLYLGRLIAGSGRRAVMKYSLKRRCYIATTSMDAELSLVTANMALAAPGKVMYDPFTGTGSFPLACAHFGACVFGSDLDGRSIRGKQGRSVRGNFKQYGTLEHYLGGFIADLTNTPVRSSRILDGILCDPPYGVREGLKVLGSPKPHLQKEVLLANGKPAHLAEDFLPPKRPYDFFRMLDDILDFGAKSLVDAGRLCMWMPVAGAVAEDEDCDGNGETEVTRYAIPTHPALTLVSECTQHFNKWSRRLLTYERKADAQVDADELLAYITARAAILHGSNGAKASADDLNDFRKKYFQGFVDRSIPRKHENLPYIRP